MTRLPLGLDCSEAARIYTLHCSAMRGRRLCCIPMDGDGHHRPPLHGAPQRACQKPSSQVVAWAAGAKAQWQISGRALGREGSSLQAVLGHGRCSSRGEAHGQVTGWVGREHLYLFIFRLLAEELLPLAHSKPSLWQVAASTGQVTLSPPDEELSAFRWLTTINMDGFSM